MENQQKFNVPDGGYGWVVCGSAFVSLVCNDGIAFTFSFFLDPIANEYQVSKSKVAIVCSLIFGAYCMVGPIASWSIEKFGTRLTQIAASLCVCFSMVVSVIMDDCFVMILLLGILGGMGFGTINVTTTISCSQYFDTKRAMAVGIATSGSGVGITLFPRLIVVLLSRLGWKEAMVVLGIGHLICCLTALSFKPVKAGDAVDWQPNNTLEPTSSGKNTQLQSSPYKKEKVPWQYFSDEDTYTDENKRRLSIMSLTTNRSSAMPHCSSKSPLRSKSFVLIILSRVICSLTSKAVFVFLPGCMTIQGLTLDQASSAIFAAGLGNTVARVFFGVLSSHFKQCSATFLTILACLGIGFSYMGLGFSGSSFNMYVVFAGLYGLCLSPYMGLVAVVISDHFGIEALTKAYGISTFTVGVSSTIGISALEALQDYHGHGPFFQPFLISGIFPILSALPLLLAVASENRKIHSVDWKLTE